MTDRQDYGQPPWDSQQGYGRQPQQYDPGTSQRRMGGQQYPPQDQPQQAQAPYPPQGQPWQQAGNGQQEYDQPPFATPPQQPWGPPPGYGPQQPYQQPPPVERKTVTVQSGSNTFHIIMTICTGGLWLLVWPFFRRKVHVKTKYR